MVLDDNVHGLESPFKHANGLPSINGLSPLNGFLSINGLPPPLSRQISGGQPPSALLLKFIEARRDIANYKTQAVKVDGHTLTTAAVVAASRYAASIQLDECNRVRVDESRQVVVDKVTSGASIYGLSTGFGGSADTRTDKPLMLGHALLQHQHIGVLPTSGQPPSILPLQDPSTSTTMPESWVRAAILIRMNSLIRGHSGIRWELIEKMNELISANITPVIPLRGSISASGDLSPLSYIAGALVGNPSIQVYHGPQAFGPRLKSPSDKALKIHSIEPIALASKEHLGIVNGTAVSAAVAALAIDDAIHLALLAQVCTAMGTEALNGTRCSYASFIHAVARPHPGQVECAQNIWNLLRGSKLAQLHEVQVSLKEDQYLLRQDRYSLRTAPQFLGPQIEDILAAHAAITQECNSTTDNPLVESETGIVHHGGNFQAMSVTNAMEKTRLALHHVGKLLFAQSTELCNPAMNHGLPPSLAASDPSLNYHGKGIDIATSSYVAELGYLATPVSTHIQSAEMHNQSVNSLALISARATMTSLDVLSMLIASYLYLLCQALDLRALRAEFLDGIKIILEEEVVSAFSPLIAEEAQTSLSGKLFKIVEQTFDRTTVMDSEDQMREVAASTTPTILDFLSGVEFLDDTPGLSLITLSDFRTRVTTKATALHEKLRREYLYGSRGPTPAIAKLGKTRGIYSYIRKDLAVKMHGAENFSQFPNAIGVDDVSAGENISKIYESIRDGQMQDVVFSLFV